MTRIWRGIRRALRVHSLCTKYAPGAFAAICVGATAQAGAWDEFEARCLLPFENHFPVIVDGLEQQPAISEIAAFDLGEGDALVIELVPTDGELACRVHSHDGADVAALRARMHQDTGRYVPRGVDAWTSNEWIEPQLAVSVQRDGDAVILRVLETDLES